LAVNSRSDGIVDSYRSRRQADVAK